MGPWWEIGGAGAGGKGSSVGESVEEKSFFFFFKSMPGPDLRHSPFFFLLASNCAHLFSVSSLLGLC